MKIAVSAFHRSVAVIILGILLATLDGTILNLALPGIARDLHASAAESVWVVNAYQLAILILLLPGAALGELIGYKRVYLGGVAIFALASFICFMATSLPMLTIARAFQGLGAAGIMAVNGALVRLVFPDHLFGRAIAVNGAVVAVGSVAGPSLAAVVLSVAPWPWLFVVNIPLGILILLLGWNALPRNAVAPAAGARLSMPDIFMNTLMFGFVFLGVNALHTRPGGTPAAGMLALALGLVGAGAVVGFFYLRRQLLLPAPLFPVDLLRIPVFALSICTSVASFSAQTLAYIALPFLLLDGWGHSTAESGLILTAWPLAIVVAAPLTGRLIGRYPSGLLGGVGLATVAIGLGLLVALPAHPATFDVAWRMALCGAGFGIFQSPNNHTILRSAPAHRSGAASGMLGTARLTGQNIGAVLLAIIFSQSEAHSTDGPLFALGLASCFAAAGSLFSLLRLRHGAQRI